MKYYRCTNNCHITDKNIPHCPRCNGKMLYDGDRSPDEINRKTEEIQRAHWGEEVKTIHNKYRKRWQH